MADAALIFEIDSSQAAGAAKALAGLNKYAAATATVAAKLETQFRKTNGQFQSQIDYVAENERDIRRLAQAYNPTLDAQLRFAEAQKEVARAVQLGVIPIEQQADVLRRLQAQYALTGTAASKMGNGVRSNVHHVQNASYQIGDFFVQVASGQNVMMAASQQLPQLLGGFGAVGAAAGAAAAILGAAWMIFSDGKTSAEALKESLDGLGDSIAKIRDLDNAMSLSGVEGLREEYGKVNAELREMLRVQLLLAEMDAISKLDTALKSLFETTDNAWYEFAYKADTGNERVRNLAASLGISADQANKMYVAMRDAMNATDTEAKTAALAKLRAEAGNILSTNKSLTAEQKEILKGIVESESMARKLLATAGQLPGAFNAAADAAGRIADRLNNAVSAAARLAAQGVSDARFAQIELDYRTDPIAKAGALAAAKFDAEVGKGGMDAGLFNRMRNQAIAGATESARIMAEVERRNDADREAERESKGGGAAARAVAQAEKQFQTLRELLEKEGLFQIAEYEKRQLMLENALSKRLLTEEQYELMRSQLRTFYFGSDYEKLQLENDMKQEQLELALQKQYITQEQYQQQLAALRQTEMGQTLGHYNTLFGNMATIAQAGGEKATGIVKAFSIAQGMINSYLAFTQVLADPSLVGKPFLRTTLAYSTLGAGLAQVAAMKSGGGGGAGGGGASSALSSQPAQPQRYYNLTFTDMTSRDEEFALEIAERIIGMQEDSLINITGGRR